jgi:hypothetical protein
MVAQTSRLLILHPEPTLCTIKERGLAMKTSNFVAFVMAVVVSTAGFAAIDYLFTRPAIWYQHHSVELMLRA